MFPMKYGNLIDCRLLSLHGEAWKVLRAKAYCEIDRQAWGALTR